MSDGWFDGWRSLRICKSGSSRLEEEARGAAHTIGRPGPWRVRLRQMVTELWVVAWYWIYGLFLSTFSSVSRQLDDNKQLLTGMPEYHNVSESA